MTHVHAVVGQVPDANRAIADFKAYASRELNRRDGWHAGGRGRVALGHCGQQRRFGRRYVMWRNRRGNRWPSMFLIRYEKPRPDGAGL